jgi:hypothetical protein
LGIDKNAADDARQRRAIQQLGRAVGAHGAVVFNETPAGAINGVNAAFTLAHLPEGPTVMLYVNGLLMLQGADYTLSAKTITFVADAVPGAGEWMRAAYRKA